MRYILQAAAAKQPTHHDKGGHSSDNGPRKHVLWVVEVVADAREPNNEGPQEEAKD